MNKDYTHITVLLDRSGSMASVAGDTIGGFNRFLADHQTALGHCTLTLAQFDDNFETLCALSAVRMVKPLDEHTFVPRGSTALLAAIGRAIDETGAALHAMNNATRPAKVLFVIITDGLENASHQVHWGRVKSKADVLAKVKHQTDEYQWQFIYIGANQDAIAEAGQLGIRASNAMDHTSNGAGTRSMYEGLSANTVAYRSTADAGCVAWSEEQRRRQAEALATP